jgi:K+-transporting ATPase KdpF subunit
VPDLNTPSHNLRDGGIAAISTVFPLITPSVHLRGTVVLTLKFIYVISCLSALGLFGYLGYALIRAEKF